MGLRHTNRSPNLEQKKKKKICKIVDFAIPAGPRIKLKECEKRVPRLCFRIEKIMEHEGNNYTNFDWCFSHGN